MTSSLTRGYAAALGAAVFLSTTAIFIRHLTVTYGIPALVLAFWRDAFVAITLAAAFALFRPGLLRAGRRHLPYLLVYGLMLACFNALWTLSVALNGAAVATVLVYCSTAFTVLLGQVFLKEAVTWARMAAVVICLAGCMLVANSTGAAITVSGWGLLAGMGAGLWYAIYSLMGRTASQRGLNPWTTLVHTFAFAGGFLTLANLIPGGPLPGSAARAGDFFWLGGAWAGWGVLFLLAAVPTVGGFGLYNVSLSHLPSAVANLIVTLEPAFTAVTAYLLLGEVLTGRQVLGSGLILTGVVVLRVFEGREELHHEDTKNTKEEKDINRKGR